MKIVISKIKQQAAKVCADTAQALTSDIQVSSEGFLSTIKHLLQQLQSMTDDQEQGDLGKRSWAQDLSPTDAGTTPSLAPQSKEDFYQDAFKLNHLDVMKQVSKTQHIKQPSSSSEISKVAWSGQNAIVTIRTKGESEAAQKAGEETEKSSENSKKKRKSQSHKEQQANFNKTTVLIKDKNYREQTTSPDSAGLSQEPNGDKQADKQQSKSSMILNYLAEGQAMEVVSLGNNTTFFLMSLFNTQTKCIELQSVNLKAKKYKRVFDVKPLTHDHVIKVGKFEIRVLQTFLTVAPLTNDPKLEQRAQAVAEEDRSELTRYQTLFTINSTKFIYMIIEQKENWFEEQIKQENLFVNEIVRGVSELGAPDPNSSIIHMGFDLDLRDSFIVLSKVGEQGYLQLFLGSENNLGRATIDVEVPRKPFNLKIFGSEGIFSHVEYISSLDSVVLMGVFAEPTGEKLRDYRYYFCCRVLAFYKHRSDDGRKHTEIREVKTFRQAIPQNLSYSGKLFEVCASKQIGGRYQLMVLIKNTSVILRLTLSLPESLQQRPLKHPVMSFQQIDLNESIGDFELEPKDSVRVSAIAKKPDEEGKYLVAYENKYCEMQLSDN